MSVPKIYYTSDLHIGHKFVSETRGFFHDHPQSGEFGIEVTVPDTEAHDAWLADLWDSTVKPVDIVYVLGDISINGGQHALDWFNARPGSKILISGNHDPVNPLHYREFKKKFRRWLETFEIITPFMVQKLLGVRFALSHFPYSGTGSEGHGEEERFTQFRLPDMGMPLLHGHTHGKETDHFSDSGTPQLHVGIDAWGRLVSQEDVMDWIKSHMVYGEELKRVEMHFNKNPLDLDPSHTHMVTKRRLET